MEVIDIGPGPHEEDVAQIGDEDFSHKNIKECRAFKAQIMRAYGEPPEGASLRIMGNPHEFGFYREVAVRVDGSGGLEQGRAAMEYAYRVESDKDGKLAQWDDHAKIELGLVAKVAT